MHFLKRLIPWRIVHVSKRDRDMYALVKQFSELMLAEFIYTEDWRHYTKSFVGDQLYQYATCVRKALDDGNKHAVTVTSVDLAVHALITAANWGELNGRS